MGNKYGCGKRDDSIGGTRLDNSQYVRLQLLFDKLAKVEKESILEKTITLNSLTSHLEECTPFARKLYDHMIRRGLKRKVNFRAF
jgi:hypothetical protein